VKIVIIVLCLISVSLLFSTIINIPDDQPTIQAGIDISVESDTVLVQPGTYIENINYNGKNITVASLFLTLQDTLYINQTIIEGNQYEDIIIFENEEDTTSVLTGFTIKDGNTGIKCINSNPRLINLHISNNEEHGIYLFNFQSIISNVCSYNNGYWYDIDGVGIYIENSILLINETSVYNNTAAGLEPFSACKGTGIAIINSEVVIKNSHIEENGNADFGAGIYCSYSTLDLDNVTLKSNDGGGIWISNSDTTIKNSILSDNYYANGNAIHFGSIVPRTLLLENCLIRNNHSTVYGGAIHFCDNSTLIINSSTISNNISSSGGAIFTGLNAEIIINNSILWQNIPQEIYRSTYIDDPVDVYVSYSCITNGETGIDLTGFGNLYWLSGNIVFDPLFINPEENDYHLQDSSSCVGAGIDTINIGELTLVTPEFDLEGNSRPNPIGSMPDMGAFENQYGEPQVSSDNLESQKPYCGLNNYPNPFNPTTTIEFSLQHNSNTELSIYNIKGQKIKNLVNNELISGQHSIIWSGDDDNGKLVSSGVYFYKLYVNGKTVSVKKCLLLK